MSISTKALERSMRGLLFALLLFFMLSQLVTALVLFESRMQSISTIQANRQIPVIYIGSDIQQNKWLTQKSAAQDIIVQHYNNADTTAKQQLLRAGLLDAICIHNTTLNQLKSQQDLQVAAFLSNRRGTPLFDKLLLLSNSQNGFTWQHSLSQEQLLYLTKNAADGMRTLISLASLPLAQKTLLLSQARKNFAGQEKWPKEQILHLAGRNADIVNLTESAKKLQQKLNHYRVKWHQAEDTSKLLQKLQLGTVQAILVPEGSFREYLQKNSLPASDFHVLWGGGMVLQQLILVNPDYSPQTLLYLQKNADALNKDSTSYQSIQVLENPIDLDKFLRESLGGKLHNEEKSP